MARRPRKPGSLSRASPRAAVEPNRPPRTVAAQRREGKPSDRLSSVGEALNRLTPEERLVCLWKALGFSNDEIARYRRSSAASTEALYRLIRAKIRRSLK